jgi:hypothetical protein
MYGNVQLNKIYMSIITIPNPQTKTFVQSNTSDVLGTMQNSFNIDLQENVGKMRVGKRMLIGSTISDVASMYCPVAFAYAYKTGSDSSIFSLTGNNGGTGRVSYQAGIHNNATQDATSNSPADIDNRYSDMMVASNGYLYATSGDTLYEMDGNGNWSATTRSLSGSTSTHMLTSYAGRLYITDLYNSITSCDISSGAMGTLSTVGNSYHVRLGLDSEASVITFIRSSASRIWIGTINRRGGKGYIHEWDGQSTAVTRSYRLESSGALSCVIKDEIPYVVDTNGDLLAFNGGTFQKLTGFYRKNRKTKLINPLSSYNNRFIHPNGISVIDGKVNILINNLNNDYTGTIEETIHSGIYEYTPENGLVHKHSFGLTNSAGTISDYGQIRVKQVGALSEIIIRDSATSTTNGSFLAGVRLYTDATTEAGYIFYDDTNDTLQKYGYFITPQIESSQLTDTWQKIFVKNKKLINSSDRIYIKSRTEEDTGVEATITFTSTTTFTVLNSAVDISQYWTAGTGGEVEITQGIGGGKCSHITNAVNVAGTWTVTVDETYTGATTQTAKARFMKWNKLKTINNAESINTQVQQFTEFPIPEYDQNDTFIQFKICFLFSGKNEMHSLNIISKTNQPLI